MIVFSNTTPIIALSSIQKLELMPQLLGEIYVVTEVIDECAAGGSIYVPNLYQLDWIRSVQSTPIQHSSVLLELDKGEKHTLDMACKHQADWVIIDERIGRNMAEYLGLRVTGTLGILVKAKQQGLIASFTDCVKAMQVQGIYFQTALISKLAQTVGEG
jgi:predicted nucleic acid-binding protein